MQPLCRLRNTVAQCWFWLHKPDCFDFSPPFPPSFVCLYIVSHQPQPWVPLGLVGAKVEKLPNHATSMTSSGLVSNGKSFLVPKVLCGMEKKEAQRWCPKSSCSELQLLEIFRRFDSEQKARTDHMKWGKGRLLLFIYFLLHKRSSFSLLLTPRCPFLSIIKLLIFYTKGNIS